MLHTTPCDECELGDKEELGGRGIGSVGFPEFQENAKAKSYYPLVPIQSILNLQIVNVIKVGRQFLFILEQ